MKKVIKASLCAFAIFAIISQASARPKKDFEKFIMNAEEMVQNYSTEAYYDKFEFTNKKTSQKKKFADFTDVEKETFMVMQGMTISQTLLEVYEKWQDELNAAEVNPTEATEAKKKEVQTYIDKLLELRKQNAVKVEKMAENLFKNYPNKFSKKEQDFVLKNIRDFNDKQNLVER